MSPIAVIRPPAGVRLFVVRHGETDWNKVQRYQGQTDIPLNATGRTQATRNGERLQALLGAQAASVDWVASPLMRTLETMRLARAAIPLEPDAFRRDDRLKEQHFGHWEGQLWTELPSIDPDGFAARAADTWGWTPRGGENYDMLTERTAAVLRTLTRDTVIVTHGNVSRVLRGLLLGLDRRAVPKLEVPQDKLWRYQDGDGRWV
jgi:broad specificity phosphatase PhoE